MKKLVLALACLLLLTGCATKIVVPSTNYYLRSPRTSIVLFYTVEKQAKIFEGKEYYWQRKEANNIFKPIKIKKNEKLVINYFVVNPRKLGYKIVIERTNKVPEIRYSGELSRNPGETIEVFSPENQEKIEIIITYNGDPDVTTGPIIYKGGAYGKIDPEP